jgi:HD-like signal output (HDOD) protein
MSQLVAQDAPSIAQRISQLVADDAVQLPPMPQLATRLRDLLSREDECDARQVAELVKNEPAVAASILRIANSAAFGGLRQVTDLHQAIARLGLRQVGSMTTALLVKGHFAAEPRGAKTEILSILWDHSVATAFASKRLANHIGRVDAEEAFLAGLLHDCGRLLVLKAVDHLQTFEQDGRITSTLLLELMETLHCELGHRTLTAWNLPAAICNVALRHEEEPVEGSEPLLVCVQAADLIAQKLGLHLRPQPDLNLLQEPAIEIVGLGDLELGMLMVDLEDELAEVHRLL